MFFINYCIIPIIKYPWKIRSESFFVCNNLHWIKIAYIIHLLIDKGTLELYYTYISERVFYFFYWLWTRQRSNDCRNALSTFRSHVIRSMMTGTQSLSMVELAVSFWSISNFLMNTAILSPAKLSAGAITKLLIYIIKSKHEVNIALGTYQVKICSFYTKYTV